MRTMEKVRRAALATASACLIVIASSMGLAEAKGDAPTVVAGKLGEAIDRQIQQQTKGMWWGAVLVSRDGKPILAKGYGYADYAGTPTDANTLFEIASVSKPVTAVAVMTLVQAGKLELSTTLGSLWPTISEDHRALTVHDLLTHTSGLDNKVGVPYNSPLAREDYVKHVLAKARIVEDAGEEFAYNNVGYALLAAIIEKTTKSSFEAYCHKHVFKPAGMRRTGFIGDKRLAKAGNIAGRLGATMPGQDALNWFWGWGYRGMGGVVTTLHDLMRFDEALRDGTLLDEAHRKKMYEVRKGGYACGWMVGLSPTGGPVVQHSGGVLGFACQFERHLDDGTVVAVLTNTNGKPFDIARAIRPLLWPRAEVSLHLDVSAYPLSPARAALFKDGLTCVARKAEGGIEVTFQDDEGRSPIRVQVPSSEVKRLLGSFTSVIRMKGGATGEPRLEAGIYLANFLGKEVWDLSDKIELQVRPRYQGTDDRITFVVVDTKRRAWPVMMRMNAAAAQKIHDEIAGAIK